MFSFNDLNLSGAEIQQGGLTLKPGKYLGIVKKAEIKDAKKKDGSKVLELKLEAIGGGGSITHWINVFSKTSAEATRIGRNELKTLLFYGGHPNPNQPGDVKAIENLRVGFTVKEQKYIKNGVEKTGSEVGVFIDPHEVDPERFPSPRAPLAQTDAPAGGLQSDEIPF